MKPLTKAEEQLMQVLWKTGPGFLKAIVEACEEPRPHSNTVATLLKILAEKGYVDVDPQGRNNLYKARISREDYGRKSVQQVVKGYFDGSPALLVSQFLSENKLSVEELEALLDRIKKERNSDPS